MPIPWMRRRGEREDSDPPVYRLALALSIPLILLSCRTGGTASSGGETSAWDLNESGTGEGRELSLSPGEDPPAEEEYTGTDRDWLEEARIAWFVRNDREATIICLDRVEKNSLEEDSRISLYRLLCRKVYTRLIPLEEKGFGDRNISSLFLDRDDLWMGTWAGGIVRYSLPLEDLTLIRSSRENIRVETITDFEEVGLNIRIAGYSDIYGFDKRVSRLIQTTPEKMGRINNLANYKGRLYASTVNQGLWYEVREGVWNPLGEGVPGLDRINALQVTDREGLLLIGTASDGVIEFDGKNFRNWKILYPRLPAKNVTAFGEWDRFMLLGTYGDGAYLVDRNGGGIAHFSKDGGDLLSDYVLTLSLEGDYALMGTLGGGISAKARNQLAGEGGWIFLGLEQGLNSLDVTALAVMGSSLYAAVLGQGVLILDEAIIEKSL